jgi:hypothetical protein
MYLENFNSQNSKFLFNDNSNEGQYHMLELDLQNELSKK